MDYNFHYINSGEWVVAELNDFFLNQIKKVGVIIIYKSIDYLFIYSIQH